MGADGKNGKDGQDGQDEPGASDQDQPDGSDAGTPPGNPEHQEPDEGGASDPGAIAHAAKQRVLSYFRDISGIHTLAGIENKFSAEPHGHTDELAGLAKRTPAFWGADFGFGGDASDESRARVIAEAKAQWEKGAVVALMYHTCVPTRDEFCEWDDIGGAHPQHLTDEEWDALFTDGTAIHGEWMARLDRLAAYLKELKDAGVAPLFRPLHEMNQCAFWWACKDGEHGTAALWKLVHDYLTKDKGLDHIVWVWNVQDFESLSDDVGYLNPGPEYFDLATLDVYNTGYTTHNYQTMLEASGGKPIGIGECQFLPTGELLEAQSSWTFFMLWPDFLYEQRNLDLYTSLFASERVLTRNELSGWN
jgi:hypothetical protein